MIDLINKIKNTPQDNTLYLIEKLPSGTGLFATNGNVLYLVPNQEQCASLSIKTEFLHLETNIFVTAFNSSVSSYANGYYNSVELLLVNSCESVANLSAFVNLCLAHASYMKGEEFISFFDSLVSLFQLPREQHYKNLVGLMGELLLIEHIYNNYGQDISTYWHTDGSSSRMDFVCPFANFEVKSTVSNSLRFTIKHNQLFSSDNNYLVAVVLEDNNTGRTLEELIANLLNAPKHCKSLSFSMNVEKEKRRISPAEYNSKRFLLKRIIVYRANDINPFDRIPDCVEGLTYVLDVLPFKSISLSSILPVSDK